MRGGRTIMIFSVLFATTAACTPAPVPPEPQPSPHPPITWRSAALPDPGGGATATVRDLVPCGGSLLAVGAIRLAGDPSVAPNEQPPPSFRPAAWRWDGSWRPLTLKPVTYYGERAVLRSAACRGNEIVAVGAASGGAHGNPRVTTWRGDSGSVLAENPNSDFQLFGGPEAVNVGDVAAGGPGFTIVGNWLDQAKRPGATVWLSGDGREWRRLPDNPVLSSTPEQNRMATALVARTDAAGARQLLLIGAERVHLTVTPLLLSSADGVRWRREELPGPGTLQRIAGDGEDLLALGLRADRTVGWRRTSDSAGWHEVGAFDLDQGTRPAQLGGAAQVGPTTLVAGCGGSTCGLWRSDDHGTQWTQLNPPATLAARADSTVRLAATGGLVALLYDDGKNAQILLAQSPL